MTRRDILLETQAITSIEGTWISTWVVPAFETTGIFRVQVRAYGLGEVPTDPLSRGFFLYESIGDGNGDPAGHASVSHFGLEPTTGTSQVAFEFIPSTRFFTLHAHDLTSISGVGPQEQFTISVRAISDTTTDGLD